MSGICFVIQPFDGGKFDKRFDDVYEQAITAAGYSPYRVDRDPSVSVPVQKIEEGIRTAAACFVDISEDNPNVWFEFGMALAFKKEICIVCSSERKARYPFDVAHLSIISYNNDSTSDFKLLSDRILKRLLAISELREKIASIETLATSNDNSSLQGVLPHEHACLAICLSEQAGLDDGVSHWTVKNSMENAGYNSIGTLTALRALIRREFLEVRMLSDDRNQPYEAYVVTERGWSWIDENLGNFELKSKKNPKSSKARSDFARDLDSEVPF